MAAGTGVVAAALAAEAVRATTGTTSGKAHSGAVCTRDGRSLRQEQLIRRWEQLIRWLEQLICEKVVRLFEKSYHFLVGTANTHKIL